MSAFQSSRRRITRVALGLAVLITLVITSLPAAGSYGPPTPPRTAPSVVVPLAGSVTIANTAWATVAMGKNDGNFDLFWQLFALNAASGRFSLVTPPGVADNGGLMVASDAKGTSVLVGFGASQDLNFSPLALTANDGRTWSQGGLPDALVATPSTLAVGATGRAISLVGGATQAVLSRSGSLTSWKTLVTSARLAATPAGQRCAIGSLEAVAFDPVGTALVGASCREPYLPGVFIDSDSQWHLADIPVPSDLASDVFAVLRLQGTSALLAGVHGKTTSLVAAWEPFANRPWVLSPALTLPTASDLLASGTGPGTTQFALVRAGKTVRAEIVAGPNANWHSLPSLPKQTATIVIAPDGQIDALSVNSTRLSVWRFVTKIQSWSKLQAISVPIVFGSSS